MPKIIVVLGPTSSGKSDLAVKLAQKFNGEIISADSRQVYKGLNLGSGKITKKEMKGVSHYLLNVASPKSIFTVSQYQKLAKRAVEKIIKKGKIPLVCGGTGLYIDALINDYKFPAVKPNPKIRNSLEKLSTEKLFEKLQKLDPVRAENIDRRNRRRLVRALEIILITKKPIPPITFAWARLPRREWRGEHFASAQRERAQFACLKIGIKKSSKQLKEKIKKRLYKRLKQGMIKEVENLNKNGVSWKRLDDLGLEYRFVSRYLRGIISRQEMTDSILKESFKYAKRQMTWFKKDKNIYWIKNEKEGFNLMEKFLKQQKFLR